MIWNGEDTRQVYVTDLKPASTSPRKTIAKCRKKTWKLQKRALTDAYRPPFGEHSRHEIHVLRRQRGDVVLHPDDFSGAAHLLPVDRTNLALEHARARAQPAVPSNQDPDELLARVGQLLRGDPEDYLGIQLPCAQMYA